MYAAGKSDCFGANHAHMSYLHLVLEALDHPNKAFILIILYQ